MLKFKRKFRRLKVKTFLPSDVRICNCKSNLVHVFSIKTECKRFGLHVGVYGVLTGELVGLHVFRWTAKCCLEKFAG